ncbi:hypothetical protein CZ797_15205 [Pseudoalteromonas sp. JB197]|nr:hypothetical protein CZ797_15205 [Pseudoalteromonas sp. JB197]
MPGTHNKAQLPSNPTLKEINWYKKQINWGELPPFLSPCCLIGQRS